MAAYVGPYGVAWVYIELHALDGFTWVYIGVDGLTLDGMKGVGCFGAGMSSSAEGL